MLRNTLRTTLRSTRLYHSQAHKPFTYSTPQTQILDSALDLVPKLGFQHKAILQASRSKGYDDSIQALFPNGTYDLIHHHLTKQREALKSYLDTNEFTSLPNEESKLKFLLKKRLLANAPYVTHLQTLQSYLILPPYLSQSSKELHQLIDDIYFYSGDFSNDFAWYSKRLSLSSIYVSLELFMSNDHSANFQQTMDLVDSKIDNLNGVGNFYNNMEEFLKFSLHSSINLIRSQSSRG